MKSVDKFDHPDFVGGVVWSSCELEWIRNRDKEWESELAEVRRENAELKEALQHPSYEVENRLRAQRDELQSNVKRMAAAARRALEAWDTTCLHAPSDGMLQERMETLREAIARVKGNNHE